MSSTLVALVHGALLQQQQAKQAEHAVSKNNCVPPSPPRGVTSTSSAITTIASSAATADAPSSAEQSPGLLRELVEIVAEIARADALLKEAEQSVPQGAEAQKWHEVSRRALRWSRDALADRQAKVLARFKDLVQNGNTRARVASTKPMPTPAPKPLWPNVNASEFCPALKQSAAISDFEQHEALRRGLKGAEHVGSLKDDLEKLRCYERECCILVRKIKQLGVQSPAKLREHFSFYGELVEVLVSHSFEKPNPKRANGRVRPAALGFLVLRSPEAAKAVLAAGEEQVMGSGADAVTVAVERYEPQNAEVGFGP